MHMKTFGRRLALLSASAITFALASGAVQAQQTVKFGALMPMTGALAQFGPTSLNGINLAIKQINAQGGTSLGRIEVIVSDTQTNPQQAVQAAKQLVSVNKVSVLVGPLASGETIPVGTSVAAVDNVPLVTGSATSPALTSLADNDFVFRTTPHDAVQGIVLGDLVKEQGLKKVAVMFRNDDYGKGLSAAFEKRFKEIGGEITSMIAFEEKQPSYRGELQRASQGGPEALVHIAFPGEGIPQLKEALEGGFFKKFVFTDGMKSDDVVKAIGGQFLNGMVGTAPEAAASDSSKAFKDAFQREYNREPRDPFVDTFYDAAFVLALAIEKAKSTDGKAIRDALRFVASAPGEKILPGEWEKAKKLLAEGKDIDYVGAAGSQDFDKAGDVPGSFGIWRVEAGAIKTVRIVNQSN